MGSLVSPIRRSSVRPAIAAILTLITISAAALRFHAIAAKCLWYDEGLSIAIARMEWGSFISLISRREANMLPYYLLLRGWMHLGSSEAFIRALSVVAALATIPAIYVLGRRLFGSTAGVVAAALLAVNAFHVRYAQEARSYSLLVLLVVLSSYCLVCALASANGTTERRNYWTAYTACGAVALYVHFFALLVLLAHGLSLLFLPEQGSTKKEFLRAVSLIGVLALPIWLFIARLRMSPIGWIHRPGAHDICEFLLNLSGNAGVPLLCLYLGASVAVLFNMRALRRMHAEDSWPYLLVLMWFCVPIAVSLGFSFWHPVFLGRYLIICLPAMILFAAAGLSLLRPRPLAVAVLGTMVWLSIGGVRAYYVRDFDLEREDFRGVASYVVGRAQPGDAILFHSGKGRFAYEYYAGRRTQYESPTIVFPGFGDKVTYHDLLDDVTPKLLRGLPGQYRRVWVVFTHNNRGASGKDSDTQLIESVLGEDWNISDQRQFAQIVVYLYTPQQMRVH